MIIKKDHGRAIQLCPIESGTGMRPLEFRAEDKPDIFVRMPYGEFGIRLRSTHPSEISIDLDEQNIFAGQLGEGEHLINRSCSQRRFTFKPRVEVRAPEVQNLPNAEDAACKVSSDAEPVVSTNGRLVVTIRFLESDPCAAEPRPPEPVSSVVFQMNPPDLHTQAFIENLVQLELPEPPRPHGCGNAL